MKTPAELATAALGKEPTLPEERATWDAIVAGIEADREQRRARLEDLHAYDHIERDDDDRDDDFDRILLVQIDTPADIGRVRVYINDGRIYDGDPETGQEWSLT